MNSTGEIIRHQIKNKAQAPDRQFIDEVQIITVPRWKESELSGDEWRISARANCYYKRQLIYSFGFSDVATAIRYLDGALLYAQEGGSDEARHQQPNVIEVSDLCDQEGCAEIATTFYKRLKDFCREGREGKVYEFNAIRGFCDRHKTRGDCGLDDADRNYEPIPTEDVFQASDGAKLND